MPSDLKNVIINGKEHEIIFEHIYGLYEAPYADRGKYHPGTIAIDTRAKGYCRLDTIIHECLHGCFPKMSEKDVTNLSKYISIRIWKRGYRTRVRKNKRLRTGLKELKEIFYNSILEYFPKKKKSKIESVSKELSLILWRLNYRKKKRR